MIHSQYLMIDIMEWNSVSLIMQSLVIQFVMCGSAILLSQYSDNGLHLLLQLCCTNLVLVVTDCCTWGVYLYAIYGS